MKRKRSLKRRAAFAALALVLVVGVIELGAAVIYWIASGAAFSYDAVEARQIQAAALAPGTDVAPGTAGVVAKTDDGAAFRKLLDDMYNTPHPYLGYVYTPEFNKDEFKNHQARYPVSRFGFVDDKPPIQKRGADRVIIGIVGGSVALQFGMEGDAALAAALAEHPRCKGKTITFVRMGLGGYKQPQQLIAISYLLSLGAEFDVLINIDGFNEIALPEQDNVRVGVYPFFPSLWNIIGARKLTRDQQVWIGKKALFESQREELARSFLAMPTKYSVALQLLWNYRDRSLRREIAAVDLELQRSPPDSRSVFAVTGPGVDGFTSDNLPRRLAEQWRTASIQLHRLCAANDITYLHFLQPNQYVKGSKKMGPEEQRRAIHLDGSYAKAVIRGYPELIARSAELRRAGVDFHDLTMVFAGNDEPLYVDTCCHFNARGNVIMAQAIAAQTRHAMDRQLLVAGRVVTGISVRPAAIVMTDPTERARLLVTAKFDDGTVRELPPDSLGAAIVAADPACVALSASGILRGLRRGDTSLTVSYRGIDLEVPVAVRFAAVISLAPGVPGSAEHTPVLTARFERVSGSNTPELVVDIQRVIGGGTGALVVSADPVVEMREGNGFPIACDGQTGLPGTGNVAIRLPLPPTFRERGQVAYCRAFIRDPGAKSGWSLSNTLRLEIQ